MTSMIWVISPCCSTPNLCWQCWESQHPTVMKQYPKVIHRSSPSSTALREITIEAPGYRGTPRARARRRVSCWDLSTSRARRTRWMRGDMLLPLWPFYASICKPYLMDGNKFSEKNVYICMCIYIYIVMVIYIHIYIYTYICVCVCVSPSSLLIAPFLWFGLLVSSFSQLACFCWDSKVEGKYVRRQLWFWNIPEVIRSSYASLGITSAPDAGGAEISRLPNCWISCPSQRMKPGTVDAVKHDGWVL